MDENLYLNLLYLLVKNNTIKQIYEIKPQIKGKELENSQIKTIQKQNTFFFNRFYLEDEPKTNIIIKSSPENFLLSYTIIVGENADLISFKSTENKEIYITEKENLKYFQDIIEENSIKKVPPKFLHKKKFRTTFKSLEIIENLKEYSLNVDNINLDEIHLVPTNKLELFLPSKNHNHYKLARKMSLPTTPLIENNYYTQTNIHIFDEKKLEKYVNPIKTIQETSKIQIEKTSKKQIYYDILKNYYLELSTDELIEKVSKIEKTNINLDKLKNQIIDKPKLKFSSNNGNLIIPLWRNTRQRFIEIKNKQNFKEISGLDFKFDTEFFNNLYFQNSKGDKIDFENKYLTQNFETAIQNLEKTQILEFKTFEEIIINLIYNNIKELYKKEKIPQNKIFQLKKKINELTQKTIKKTIELNSKGTKSENKSLLTQYFESIAKTFESYIEEYENTHHKNHLINTSLEKLELLIKAIEQLKLTEEEIKPLIDNLEVIKHIGEEIESSISQEISSQLDEFFPKRKNSNDLKRNIELENAIENIILLNENPKYEILFTDLEPEIQNLVKNPSQIMQYEPDHQTFLKPKTNYLKKIFPYSHKEITEKIRNQQTGTMEIKKRIVRITPDFYIQHKKYHNYNTVSENHYFKILHKK